MKIKIADLEFEQLITYEAIQSRVKQIARQLNKDYENKNPMLVGVLNGCFLFMADIVKQVTIPCEIAFTKLSSYQGGVSSTRRIRDDLDLTVNIEGRHIILIEDIVDTGNTLDYLVAKLKQRHPASIIVCAMLVKPDALEYELKELKHIAFEIENEFVVGYGLDYMEMGRNLKGVYKRII